MAFSSWIRSWKGSIERRWALYRTLRRKVIVRRRASRPRLEALEDRWLLSAYVVTSTADDGSAGTLRDAINQANASGSTITEIDFNIGTTGSAQTISPTSALPSLTANGVFINGLSQGGSGNTKQLITLDGTNAGSSSDGLLLKGSGCIVSGLILEHFKNGIEIAGSTNTIGGTASGARNVISGNSTNGVLIDSSASGNQVQGNYIGTDVTGTKALANSVGIQDSGNHNTLGGSVQGARNVISGNTSDGILLVSGANAETLQGNYIGLGVSGKTILANGRSGVEVRGTNNTIGGNSQSNYYTRNFVSGNAIDGVAFTSTATGNVVQGNFIGLDISGTKAAGNVVYGIEIGGSSNSIGGTTAGVGNFISGNKHNGMLLNSTDSSNVVQGNYIGTDYTGKTAVANSGSGIEVAGTGNTLGGTSSAARNILSGNSSDGVRIDSSASGTLVQGNYLGLNISGTALNNGGNGGNIAGNNNTVGGTVSGSRNIISGNSKDGVLLASSASGNQVLGNYIGTDSSGITAVANSGNGIEIAGTSNTLGGTGSAARNIVSGNSKDGVLLDSTASGNQVLGNYIGTTNAGTAALANSIGIEDAGNHNTLGGSVSGARNVISGNSKDGLLLDSTATTETVQSNIVGLTASGKAALANGSNGLEIQGSNNIIGGASGSNYYVRNFFSGNANDGVLIDSGATGNQVLGNFIGLDITGTNGAGNLNGIEIAGNSNSIGSTTSGNTNFVSGNKNNGVLLDSTATGNVIQGNDIGTDYTGSNAVANSGNGVAISGSNNTVGGSVSGAGNIIANNSGDGALVSTGSGNSIRRNSIYNNAGGGISLGSGANNNIAAPILSSAALSASTVLLHGTFTAQTANVSYVLEFFANPSGDAEGKYRLGSLTVTPTSTGTQNFNVNLTNSASGTNPLITATLTDNIGDTSAFSNGVMDSSPVLTYHNDNSSTGQNLSETILTPSNVNSSTFGKLFPATIVDGQVYAQPLYAAGVNITTGTNQGAHNVVFVATQHDSLYAINADNGTILWHDTLLHAVHSGTVTSVPNSDVNSDDISPEIGVTATPVIDPATNLLYIEAKTKEVASDGTHYIHQLYAVNISNGSYVKGSPIVIADSIVDTYVSGPTVNGTGDGSSGGIVYFDALRQMERPGLTEANGNIYLAFASHGDNGPYHGWVLSYNASTLALDGVFNTTPNGGLGGIWQAGGRLAVDASGNLYFETGNGTFDTTLNANGMPVNGNYGDSFVKIAVDPTTSPTNQNINGWGLKAVDYFTPFDEQNLNNGDFDLGSGGPMLLPDSVGSGTHPHLMVGAGKEGRIYLIDRDNMGHFDANTDHVVQETNNTTITGSFDTPAYFNGSFYYVGGSNIGNPNDVGKSFSIANGQMSLTPTSQGPDSYAYPGDTASISANGTSNGIVWATDTGMGQLRAYNATDLNNELYTSAQASGNRDALTGSVIKFAVPTVADGLVFVGTSDALNVYGLFVAAKQAPAAPSNLKAAALSGTAIQLTWQDNSTYPNTATGFDIEQSTDGVNFTQVATANAGSTSYTVGGLQTSTTYTFRIRAFNAIGISAYSNTASATTTNQTPTLNFSNGFANSGGLLTFNGTAKINGTDLELTDGGTTEAGSAFSTSQVDITHFNTQFSFQLSAGSNTADGFTFCIQTAGNTALGPTGGGLGYGPDTSGGSGGIPNSIAIKFDLYSNQGEGTDSTGLYTDGAAPTNSGSIDLTNTGINLHSGDVINVNMAYDGTTLTVTESDPTVNASATQSYTINIPNTVGNGTAFVGFTGGTGGLTAVQDILTWTYTVTTPATPVAPVNLTTTAASAAQVNLTWTNYSANQTGFHIDRATDSAFTQNLVTQTAAANVTSFADVGLTVGTTYYYRVRAFNDLGDSPNSNNSSVTTPTLPAPVSNLHVTNATSNEIDLSWTNNATNATSIQVFRQKGSNSFILIASLSPDTTSLADTGLVVALKPGTTYTYNVQAMNAAGPSSVTSVRATTASNSPALQLTNGGNNKALSAVPTNKVNVATSSTIPSLQLPNSHVDGSMLTIQGNSPTTLVAAGGGLSEGLNQTESLGSIGLDINGVVPTNAGLIALTDPSINLPSADPFTVHMTYNGTAFMVKTTDASTGASATEDLLNWTSSTTTT